MSTRLVNEHVEFNYRSVAEHVDRRARVLDVGAWDARLGALLHERLGCSVMNVDVVNHNATSLPFVVYDGKHLPFADGSHDVVLLMYVLHHSRDASALLSEAARVCHPSGLVVVAEDRVDGVFRRLVTVLFHVWLWLTTRLRFYRFRAPAEWLIEFERAGLSCERQVELGSHMGRRGWPENMLFVLRRADALSAAPAPIAKVS